MCRFQVEAKRGHTCSMQNKHKSIVEYASMARLEGSTVMGCTAGEIEYQQLRHNEALPYTLTQRSTRYVRTVVRSHEPDVSTQEEAMRYGEAEKPPSLTSMIRLCTSQTGITLSIAHCSMTDSQTSGSSFSRLWVNQHPYTSRSR
jgi:hypothetical protein